MRENLVWDIPHSGKVLEGKNFANHTILLISLVKHLFIHMTAL